MQTEVTESAIRALGLGTTSDYKLHPSDVAKALGPEAGPLARALQGAAISTLMQRYSDLDLEALAGLVRFRRLSRAETLARVLEAVARPAAILIGFILLVPTFSSLRLGDLHSLSGDPTVSKVAFVIEFAALLVIAATRVIIAKLRPYQRWLETRARAERFRYQVFEAVMQSDESPGGGELPLLPLQLEFYVRYNLMVNLSYYRMLGSRMRPRGLAALQASWPATALLFALAAAWGLLWLAALADVVPLPTIWIERSFFVLSAIAALLLGTKRSIGEIQFEQRAELEKAHVLDNLEYLIERHLDSARLAAVREDRAKVLQFVGLVQSQILAEFASMVRLREFDIAPTAGG
jgi:hypothetical protein